MSGLRNKSIIQTRLFNNEISVMDDRTFVYDMAKILTTLLVVLAHATRMYTTTGAIHPINKSLLLANVTEYIYQFHMPLFILLSGCIYDYCLTKGRYKANINFLIGKARRLLIPYLFFCNLLYV